MSREVVRNYSCAGSDCPARTNAQNVYMNLHWYPGWQRLVEKYDGEVEVGEQSWTDAASLRAQTL